MLNKNELEKYSSSERWFNYKKFYEWIVNQHNFTRFVEIGVWKGHSIIFLTQTILKKNIDNFEIYAVDVWDNIDLKKLYPDLLDIEKQNGNIYDIYNYNLNKNNVRKYIVDVYKNSIEAATFFDNEYFDFIFIDADHSYSSTKQEILAWLPKLKKNGIIAGHDYKQKAFPGVERAVNEIFGNYVKIFPYDGNTKDCLSCAACWYVNKNEIKE